MMPIQVNDETFLSTAETCNILQVSREMVNRYVKQGLIKRYKQGLGRNVLYKEADVYELARKRSQIVED